MFDIKKFNKNKDESEEYVFTDNGGTITTQYGNSDIGYFEYSIKENSLFENTKTYYNSGELKSKGVTYINNNFQKGIWYYYNKEGNIEKTIDFDEPYLYAWEDLKNFCDKNEINLYLHTTTIAREIIDGKPTWEIDFFYGNGATKVIKLDGKTGEILDEELLLIEK